MARRGVPRNPLKAHGESKRRTTELSARTRPSGPRSATINTRTGQGGSLKGRWIEGARPSSRHPGQRGGARSDEPAADPRHAPHGRHLTKKVRVTRKPKVRSGPRLGGRTGPVRNSKGAVRRRK